MQNAFLPKKATGPKKKKKISAVGTGFAAAAVGLTFLVFFVGKENAEATQTTGITQDVPEKTVSLDSVEPGQYFRFGTYDPTGCASEEEDTSISWIVLDVDRQTGEIFLLTENIVDLKPFDTAESGTFDRNRLDQEFDPAKADSYSETEMALFKGNSDWNKSNIRTFLNSDQPVVEYQGALPVNEGSDEGTNGYSREPGFLFYFSVDEKKMISAETECDKVFLLSAGEYTTYVRGKKPDGNTMPTALALESNHSSWYLDFMEAGNGGYFWALRDQDETDPAKVRVVNPYGLTGQEFGAYYPAIAGMGIRPATRILPGESRLEGSGTKEDPYRLVFAE